MGIELLLLGFHPPVLQKRRAAATEAAAHGDESSTATTATIGAASFVYCYVPVALAAEPLFFPPVRFVSSHRHGLEAAGGYSEKSLLIFHTFTPSAELTRHNRRASTEQKHRNLELIFFFFLFFPRTTHTHRHTMQYHISNDVNNK